MNIVFDIGGSKMRVASSNDGQALNEAVILPTLKNFDDGFARLVSTIKDIAGNQTIESVTGGIAGRLNKDKSQLQAATNLPNWAGKNLKQGLVSEFNSKVLIENDAALGAIGEATFGAGKNFSSVMFITIGTGLGGAWIIDGKLAGDKNFEPGQHILNSDNNSTWETLVDTATNPAEQIHYLALGLNNTLQFWPSDIIVLGGGKTIHKGWRADAVNKELRILTEANIHVPEVVFTELGDQAVLYGALHLIK
ncbi:MAG TPA: ROK family protein [Candidatus Doudnabacteria bacterium]|nr:ROK family protein [Candidatus Doudnabacteria bacterium]